MGPKSKEFVVTDSEDSDYEKPKKKKQKTEPKKEPTKVEESASGVENSWPLSKMRRVTVDEFRGKKLVSIREYYTDKESGEERPGRKGISLSVDQWSELVKVVDKVNDAL